MTYVIKRKICKKNYTRKLKRRSYTLMTFLLLQFSIAYLCTIYLMVFFTFVLSASACQMKAIFKSIKKYNLIKFMSHIKPALSVECTFCGLFFNCYLVLRIVVINHR